MGRWARGFGAGFVVAVACWPATARADDSGSLVTDIPWHPIFGDGSNYTTQVVLADVGAMALSAATIAIGWATAPGHDVGYEAFAIATVPYSVTGPIVHFAHGRIGPGIVSLLGWGSFAATAELFGYVLAASPCSLSSGPCVDNTPRGAAFALAVSASGGMLMTILDGWMARTMTPAKRPAKAVGLTVVPVPSGAMVGVAGTL